MRTTATLATAAIMLMGTAHAAQTGTVPGMELVEAPAEFHQLDVNGDGQLTKEEVAASPTLAASFDDIDQNRDGALSLDEYTRYPQG